MYAATLALDRIPLGDSPREAETRRAIDMLRTAMAQQANYPDNRSGLHGTPYNSQLRQQEVSSTRQRIPQVVQHNPLRPVAPAASTAYAMVNSLRERRASSSTARAEKTSLTPDDPPTRKKTGQLNPTTVLAGSKCLSDDMKNSKSQVKSLIMIPVWSQKLG